MKRRVRYCGEVKSLYGKEGWAKPDRSARRPGPHRGLWYFEPDERSGLPEDGGGFCVAEEELEFLKEDKMFVVTLRAGRRVVSRWTLRAPSADIALSEVTARPDYRAVAGTLEKYDLMVMRSKGASK